MPHYLYICMNVHVYVYVCLSGGICGQGWHVVDGNLRRDVDGWLVFAQVRLSAGFLHSLTLFCSAEWKAAGGCMKGKFLLLLLF